VAGKFEACPTIRRPLTYLFDQMKSISKRSVLTVLNLFIANHAFNDVIIKFSPRTRGIVLYEPLKLLC
jgi:hypothetical protein